MKTAATPCVRSTRRLLNLFWIISSIIGSLSVHINERTVIMQRVLTEVKGPRKRSVYFIETFKYTRHFGMTKGWKVNSIFENLIKELREAPNTNYNLTYTYLRCKCGQCTRLFEVKPISASRQLEILNRSLAAFSLAERMSSNYVECPRCKLRCTNRATGEKSAVQMGRNVFIDESHIRLSMIAGYWKYIPQMDEIIYDSTVTRLTYNKRTRNVYLVHKKRSNKNNSILRCANFPHYTSQFQRFFHMSIDAKDERRECFEEFIKACYAHQGRTIPIPLTDKTQVDDLYELITRIKYAGLDNCGWFTASPLLHAIKSSKRKAFADGSASGKILMKKLIGRSEKSVRKLFMSNPTASVDFSIWCNLIEDVNCLVKICTKLYDSKVQYRYMRRPTEETDIQIRYIKGTIEYIGTERRLAHLTNKAVRGNRNLAGYIEDCGRMYLQLKDGDVEPPDQSRFNHLERIHDELSKTVSKMGRPNIEFKYEDYQKELEMEHEGYSLKLAKDSHELIEVGSLMKICVGSYGQSVRDAQLLIVVAYTTDGEPAICYEIRGKKNAWFLRQAKCIANSRPEGDKLAVTQKWVKKHKIDTKDCYDLNGRRNVWENPLPEQEEQELDALLIG